MRLPASSMARNAKQTLPFPPGGGNADRIPKTTSFVKRRSCDKQYFNINGNTETLCPFNCFRALYNG